MLHFHGLHYDDGIRLINFFTFLEINSCNFTRPVIGQIANEVRTFIESRIDEAKKEFVKKERSLQLEKEVIKLIEESKPICLPKLQNRYLPSKIESPNLYVDQHDLNNYDKLIENNNCARGNML